MEAPKRATKFAANDEWGKVYRNMFGVAKMNQSLSILTGASAGATEAFVVVPFELVKIRLQGKHRKPRIILRSRTDNHHRQGAGFPILWPSRCRSQDRQSRGSPRSLPGSRVHHVASHPLELWLLRLHLPGPSPAPCESDWRQVNPGPQ
jgi:hypothetical protein